MKIYIIPMVINGFSGMDVVIRLRPGEANSLFMHGAQIIFDGYREHLYAEQKAVVGLFGHIAEGQSLQDGDVLLVQAYRHNDFDESFVVDVQEKDGAYVSEGLNFTSVAIAAGMEKRMCACIADIKYKNVMSTAVQIYNKAMSLYKEYPAFREIMGKDSDGATKEMSLTALISTQDSEFIKWAETMMLSMESKKYKTLFPVAKQILENISTDNGFTLLSKEEQVAAFLEFSKRHADKAQEMVPDKVIDYIKSAPEYGESLRKLKQAGLGESATQQFNVLQQVGYLEGNLRGVTKGRIIYNLSDMGAGKTLMTVQAIFVMDCIRMGMWAEEPKNEFVNVNSVYLPDKHIIAPALSVKASWVDTFKLFYDVEKDTDYHYVLKASFGGVEAVSDLYIAPFAVRSGKVFVQQTLPASSSHETYLIVDEIHQLVKRRISRTKFFIPKLVPIFEYRIFALSGTMSNLKTGEWLSLIRFLGDTDILETASQSKKHIDSMVTDYRCAISTVAQDLETLQHRKFNIDDITQDTNYDPNVKKKSVVEENYFMQYGSKMLVPSMMPPQGVNVQKMLANQRYSIMVDPEETDNVSFELFYHIAATSAITAQSLQIAEELFGKQATQHKSSIIKTISPFTDMEIELLDTLHKIAADANKYRSINIGRDINNAILNLNDGLQKKDLYTLVSGFAQRNTKFLEYLAGLDVDVLEQLPKTSLIKTVPLVETHKFMVLKELIEKDKNETFLIVVNDFYAMKALAEALGVDYLSKQELKDEMAYQELLDGLFEKQNIVIVTQDMIKSSLDLVQANRLVQYQLNTEVSDIIQTQNRINRIGQTRETRCYYIAADRLQNALIELFLDSYRNIRVAHKGIVELFADLSSQIDVINDYLNVAFKKLNEERDDETSDEKAVQASQEPNSTDLVSQAGVPENVQSENGICSAILFPQKKGIMVIIPLKDGKPFTLGILKDGIIGPITAPTRAMWNLTGMKLIQDS